MSKAIAWWRPHNNAYERPFLTGGSASGQTASVNANSAKWWPQSPPTTFAYQWFRGTNTVANATSASYGITSTDRGSAIACTVSATNVYGGRAFGVGSAFVIS
jgi:hypothetical protein